MNVNTKETRAKLCDWYFTRFSLSLNKEFFWYHSGNVVLSFFWKMDANTKQNRKASTYYSRIETTFTFFYHTALKITHILWSQETHVLVGYESQLLPIFAHRTALFTVLELEVFFSMKPHLILFHQNKRNVRKKKELMYVFRKSQFSYIALTWK